MASDQPILELFNPSSSPVKGDAYPSNGLVVEASGSTRDHNRDSVMVISGDKADQSADESDSDSDSWESATNSIPALTQQLGTIASHFWRPRR